MTRTWNMHATRGRGGLLWHIGHKRWVELHGLTDPIVPVLVEEVEDRDDQSVTHFGWEHVDKPDKPTMIWPKATSSNASPWMLLDMCFAYGMQAEIDRGVGRMIPLRITEEP